jgi:hypothetical protein
MEAQSRSAIKQREIRRLTNKIIGDFSDSLKAKQNLGSLRGTGRDDFSRSGIK